MFGKRPTDSGAATGAAAVRTAPPPAAAGPAIAPRPQRVEPGEAPAVERPAAAAGPKKTAGLEQLRAAQGAANTTTLVVREQSDFYHATKTTIFNALLNTIDLSQLAQLESKVAAEE